MTEQGEMPTEEELFDAAQYPGRSAFFSIK